MSQIHYQSMGLKPFVIVGGMLEFFLKILTVPEEGIVYGVTDDNQIITELAEIFKEENSNNVEDSEVAIISIKSSGNSANILNSTRKCK